MTQRDMDMESARLARRDAKRTAIAHVVLTVAGIALPILLVATDTTMPLAWLSVVLLWIGSHAASRSAELHVRSARSFERRAAV